MKTKLNYIYFSTEDYNGKKVLVIDDNQTNLAILKSQLEQWKLSPFLASSGKQALEILSSMPGFDLVITDMQMPEMDGKELARHIKNIAPQLPIIFLSSIGDDSSKKYPELFKAVLSKPVKPQELIKLIQLQFCQKFEPGLPAPLQEKILNEAFAIHYPLKILIAEDHPVNQMLAEMLLNKLGYQPCMASTGIEVLQKLTEQTFDLILMDVQMPEMDGLEATRIIRKQAANAQPIIMAVTANAMKEDREMCLEAGMDDYISKPIQAELLKEALKKAAMSLRAYKGF